MFWQKLKFNVSDFFRYHGKKFKRVYWTLIIAATVVMVGVPIYLGIVHPHVQLAITHGVAAGPMQEWNRTVAAVRREVGRANDFAVLVDHLSENYPFLTLSEAYGGVNYMVLATEVFDRLMEEAIHETRSGFFRNWLTDNYIELLGGFGALHLTSEPAGFDPWMEEPYFFGYYDWRFDDERFEIPTREGNVTSERLGDGIQIVRINSFIPRGYESISRLPFWYFDREEDAQNLTALFAGLKGTADLIIDIRGIGSGFGDYFVPLVLAPLLHEPLEASFFAFHTAGLMAQRVSAAYRAWYGLGDTFLINEINRSFLYTLPANLVFGFPIELSVAPAALRADFDGQIWLLTDSDSFCGPNFMYLQLARDAGFNIIYESNPEAMGWATSFPTRLPYSSITVRFNPLYFTDALGRSLEGAGAFHDYRLQTPGDWDEVMAIVNATRGL